jgi:hypothetical protein
MEKPPGIGTVPAGLVWIAIGRFGIGWFGIGWLPVYNNGMTALVGILFLVLLLSVAASFWYTARLGATQVAMQPPMLPPIPVEQGSDHGPAIREASTPVERSPEPRVQVQLVAIPFGEVFWPVVCALLFTGLLCVVLWGVLRWAGLLAG